MSRLNDVQDEIEILKAELKFRRALGMATSDVLEELDELKEKEYELRLAREEKRLKRIIREKSKKKNR